MRVPVLLLAAAGFLGAFTWIEHGHVFTNAQTGNVVLFFATAALGDWTQAARHVPPMLGFFPGVFAARWLYQRASRRGLRSAAVSSLAVEITILAVVGIMPASVPDAAITFCLAFAAALQNSAFARIGDWSYASVVTTGNLRSAAEALYATWFGPRDVVASQRLRAFTAVNAAFVVGAASGAAATVATGRVAMAGIIVLLCLALRCCLLDAEPPPGSAAPSPAPESKSKP